MPATSQAEKAEALRALHHADRLLVLPNIWDPIGARVLEASGYPAVATASAALSASLGFRDGERVKRSTLLQALARIAGSVGVPVTADIERGYGDSIPELRTTIEGVIAAGVVGINLEDGLGDGRLRPVDAQCERLAAVREVANAAGVQLVINARTDAFVSNQFGSAEDRIEESATRATAYTAAGADCIYPIGPGDADTVRALRARIQGPLNILGSPRAAPLAELQALGVQRVSFGPNVFRACLKTFLDIVRELHHLGDYHVFGAHVLAAADVQPYLRPGPE